MRFELIERSAGWNKLVMQTTDAKRRSVSEERQLVGLKDAHTMRSTL